MTMKEELERALQPLIGEPLSDMSRFAGMQMFEFGIQRPCKNRKGQDITLADQRLHVSCYWCVSSSEGTIISCEDFDPNGSRRDARAYPFYNMLESNPPIVEVLEADEAGTLRLYLSGGYSLIVRPN